MILDKNGPGSDQCLTTGPVHKVMQTRQNWGNTTFHDCQTRARALTTDEGLAELDAIVRIPSNRDFLETAVEN